MGTNPDDTPFRNRPYGHHCCCPHCTPSWYDIFRPLPDQSEGLALLDRLEGLVTDHFARLDLQEKRYDSLKERLVKMIEALIPYAKHGEYPEGDPPIVHEAESLLRECQNEDTDVSD